MNTALRAALLTLLLALAPAAPAGDDAPPLDAFLDQLRSLQADFLQTVYDEDGRPQQQSSGRLFMRRPGRFRWDYRQPYAQQIVADGERLWLYDQDLAQVTVRPLGRALRGGPLVALSGTAPLADNFTVSYQGIEDNLRWYQLRPRSTDNDGDGDDPSQFSELRLGFDLVAEQPLLRRLTLQDGFGRRTELRLAGLQRNPPLDDALFEFSPPHGVDVVGE